MDNNFQNAMNNGNPSQQTTPPPYYYAPTKRKKTRWWIPIIIIGLIILFFFIIIMGMGIAFSSMFNSEPKEVKENSALYLNLNYNVSEYTTSSPFNFLSNSTQASFLDIISAIKNAKTDDRIKAIYIKAENSTLGIAKLTELNQVIEDFKSTGKLVYAYMETGTEKDYMLTLPAQKIFMPLEGLVMIDGFGTLSMFYKGFFDKIGVNFYVAGFEDFKSAADSYSKTKYGDSSKYQLQVYTKQVYDNFLDAINKFRKIDKNKSNQLIDEGIYTIDGMKAAGFIDEIAVESKVKEELAKMVYGKNWAKDKKINFVKITDYINSKPYSKKNDISDDTEIAIVYGSGAIYPGSNSEIFSTEKSVFANQFVKNLKKAVDNEKVKAIIIRIDSPGGSVLGSEIIWQEIIEAKKIKPIYASMSDVAASGGYYIASACDTIIAHPQTLTGSIGVISAIPNFSGSLNKLGITIDTTQTNKNTHFFNPSIPVAQSQKDKFYEMSKTIYYRFLNKVATSRKMDVEQVRSIAKGRIWTGSDAKRIGLVDVLGGLGKSIEIAKNRIGIPPNKSVKVSVYPSPDSDYNSLFSLFKKNSNDDEDESKVTIESYLNALSIKYGQNNGYFNEIYKAMPKSLQNQFMYLMNILQLNSEERVLMAMPNLVDVN